MRVGSLFSGIGGIDLGLERAGMEIAWQVENDEYCSRVLARHWPGVRRWGDVRTFEPDDSWAVDLIAGGFPCQDISDAGTRTGIVGKRSGLWSDFIRVVRLVRPRFVIVENSAALARRGLGRVLGDLSASGFDAEWRVLAASDFGAPHIRERMFIVGYSRGWIGAGRLAEWHQGATRSSAGSAPANTNRDTGCTATRVHAERASGHDTVGSFAGDIKRRFGAWCGWQSTSPELCRVDDGISGRLDRLRGLGNAVVPQVAESIGRCIMNLESP